MNKEENIEIFNDTIQKVIFNDDLLSVVNESTKNQKYYIGNSKISPQISLSSAPVKVEVSKLGTFDAALKYDNACVLNFASATSPGGGVVKGSNAQEETLCRCSTLYFNLNDKVAHKNFYNEHNEVRKSGGVVNNDDIIYTPNVQIMKDNNYKDLTNVKSCAVITCAAPNLRLMEMSDEDLYKTHLQRGRKIINVALENGHTTLVLGAFGCGAFRNNPKVVAKAYKDLMEEFKYKLRKVEFAVYSPDGESENYKIFKETFSN